jgi:hypothetical protein
MPSTGRAGKTTSSSGCRLARCMYENDWLVFLASCSVWAAPVKGIFPRVGVRVSKPAVGRSRRCETIIARTPERQNMTAKQLAGAAAGYDDKGERRCVLERFVTLVHALCVATDVCAASYACVGIILEKKKMLDPTHT